MKTTDWTGRAVVVTGAAGAIGTEICLRLDRLGMRIVAVDLRADGLEGLAAKLSRPPLTVAGDLTDPATHARVRQVLESECGGCQVLINNAGMVVTEPFETADPALLRREIEVNLLAPMLLTRALFSLLQKSGDGRVISVVSLGSILPLAESPGYSASKFGLRGFMLGLVLRQPRTGVSISTVNPGSVDTPMLRHEAMTGGSPLNFIDPPLKPEQVAEVVLARLHRPRPETDITAADGWLSRLGMLFPNLFHKLLPWFAKRGERGRQRYLKERGLERTA